MIVPTEFDADRLIAALDQLDILYPDAPLDIPAEVQRANAEYFRKGNEHA